LIEFLNYDFKNIVSINSKSLNQLKDINMQLSQRNKQLQAQMSLSESERRETERQLNSKTMAVTDRESDVSILKRENETLREKVNKLETEKKILERSYSLIEKEKSSLRGSLDDIQRKTNKTFQNSSRNDVIIDEAKIITQGLAALEQKNLELQRKVQGLQSLMNEAESLSSSDMATQINGNISQHSNHDMEKLRLAQKQAQNLIDRKDSSSKHISELEKEVQNKS
jgi:chromosome segregation ATPase